MANIDAIVGALSDPERRRTHTVRLPINVDDVDIDELIEQHARADLRLTDMLEAHPGSPQVDELRRAVEETEAAIAEACTPFTFASIGKKPYVDLVADHPPTKDDLKVDPRAEVHAETFQPALLAASCTSPEMNVDQAAALMSAPGMSDDMFDLLVDAAILVNRGGGVTPKSVVAGTIRRRSARSATTAALAESLVRSSSAES